ncbi:hypothetical protein UFOVP190_371 [uncultured Caudovirales phage]|uniref:Uncharacterized protein n=1 Tax=uncultured Caudovirales phage TaxID=2100421 RepID=A0A6J7WH90_9CAUD|nr:hypothetical protein UFOVP190_371 [uncultured Caudovirales phage]
MASTINTTNIDVTYPIAGQDNDTQGFRDNFRNIKNNLNTAASEITAIQANVTTLQTAITTLANLSQTQVSALTPVAGMIVYNYTYSNVQVYSANLSRWANITLS